MRHDLGRPERAFVDPNLIEHSAERVAPPAASRVRAESDTRAVARIERTESVLEARARCIGWGTVDEQAHPSFHGVEHGSELHWVGRVEGARPFLLYFVNSELFARADASVMAHFGFHGGTAMAMLVFSLLEGTTELDARGGIVKTRWQDEIREIASGRAWGTPSEYRASLRRR